MGSWLVSAFVDLHLRYLLICIFALTLALSGKIPVATAAQGLGAVFTRFSNDTLPVDINGKGQPVLCKRQKYKILAQGALTADKLHGPKPVDEIITAQGTLNPVVPDRVRRLAHDPAAVFYYNPEKPGEDAIEFVATEVSGGATRPLGSRILSLEVRECSYKVEFHYIWQMKLDDASFVQFGVMAETRLEQKDDGTFAGTGPFLISQMVSSPGCAGNLNEFEAPTDMTGTLQNDATELQIKFKFGKGTMQFRVACEDQSKAGNDTMDVSSIGFNEVTFPVAGGSKQLPTQGGMTPGKIIIVVNREVTNIAR